MEDRTGKTVVARPGKAVPATVWAAAGVLFFAVALFAHTLPDAKTAEAIEYFNVDRLERFPARSSARAPRIVAVGTSLTMSALFFDEELARFARENGLPEVDLVRFIKLDSALEDFAPLLDPILAAEPDAVFFETRLFTLINRLDDRKARKLHFITKDDGSDDRKKLKLFFTQIFSKKAPSRKRDNPNIPVSEQRLLEKLGQRQNQRNLWEFQDAMEERFSIRPFSVPAGYQRFYDALKQKRIAAILLDAPVSHQELAIYAKEMETEIPALIRRYEEACGMRYLEYPGQRGLEYFNDFRHMNERGRDAYSRWFLSEIPKLAAKRKPL